MTRYIFEWYIFTGFTQWTFSVFGQAYLPIVGKHYFIHITKGITGFIRWTLGVFCQAYLPIVGKYYLTHISKLITGFSRWTLGVFGRPYWVVVSKYYLMHISTYKRCVYTHINSDQRVYLMVSRAKPGKIASSPNYYLRTIPLCGVNKIDAEGIDFVQAAAGKI